MRIMSNLLIGFALTASLSAHAATISIKVKSVEQTLDEMTKQPAVDIILTKEATRRFAQFTQERVGKQIYLRIDGTTIMSATLLDPITGGMLRVSSQSMEDAHRLADRIDESRTIQVSDEENQKSKRR